MSLYHLNATISTKNPEILDTIRPAIAELARMTRKEEGCITFRVMEKAEQPGTFYLWESWKNKAALDAHFSAPHTLEFLAHDYTQVDKIEEVKEWGGQE